MGREQRDSYLLVMGRGQSEEPAALSSLTEGEIGEDEISIRWQTWQLH
jgi:hypothetical protein